jgi:hypothetical protein
LQSPSPPVGPRLNFVRFLRCAQTKSEIRGLRLPLHAPRRGRQLKSGNAKGALQKGNQRAFLSLSTRNSLWRLGFGQNVEIDSYTPAGERNYDRDPMNGGRSTRGRRLTRGSRQRHSSFRNRRKVATSALHNQRRIFMMMIISLSSRSILRERCVLNH